MDSEIEKIVLSYQAEQSILYRNEKVEHQLRGQGGGLSEAIELYGLRPVFGVLKPAMKIELHDDEQTVVLSHMSDHIQVQTFYSGQPPAVSIYPIPAKGQSRPQSPRPTPTENVEAPKPLLPALAAIAIWNPDRKLYLQAGKIYDQAIPMPDGIIPSFSNKQLGAEFCDVHQVDAPYVVGAMAGGIASVEIVRRMASANLLSFFGTGGLGLTQVEEALKSLSNVKGPCGFNLLHNPAEPSMEEKTVDLFLQYGIRHVSASAYVRFTPALVRYRVQGLTMENGVVRSKNHIFAKCSHPSVAQRFMEPPPKRILAQLVAKKHISQAQAELAAQIPMAEDVTIESDSGGHTDRRPFPVLLPTMRVLRDKISSTHNYKVNIRLGVAGGIGDPYSVLAAFELGADYILTGSINQASPEAGTSEGVKALLIKAGITDCKMGAAPDMFEQGAHVQVLGKGTMYAQRSTKLRNYYQMNSCWEDIIEKDRKRLEDGVFKRSFDDLWTQTKEYWQSRDARQVERAERDPKHKMALCFRWYLGMSSRWARIGEPSRVKDYQIWCGPSMGAFNSWVSESWLDPLSERHVDVIARVLLRGALSLQRLRLARQYGIKIPFAVRPDQSFQNSKIK